MGGLDRMKQRVLYTEGDISGDRNVQEKYLSFQSALRDPYQSEIITFNDTQYRCLINPDKLKESYDQKEISIDFEAGMKPGDVFYWDRTKSYWLVFLEEHTEEAYFRASIRRCNFKIYDDWVWLRGPVETALVWRQKHGIEFNELNYSILFYVVASKENIKRYSRLNIIKFDGHNWRVSATDKYSQPNIIEVYAEEYFDNKMEDAMVIPAADPEPVIVEEAPVQPYIDGPRTLEAFSENVSYSIVNKAGGKFAVNHSKVKITKSTETSCTLDIMTGKATTFNVIYKVTGEDSIVLPVTIKSI